MNAALGNYVNDNPLNLGNSMNADNIIPDTPSTSYWICQNGSYVWIRTGSDPDSGMGVGNRPGRPGPNPTD